MLDTDTKRRIDTARDILVGKVPDPKSQVEQITIALIYKFMDDMDAESEELGGQRKFFAGEYARYGWAKLMRSGLGGHETLNLYGEAIAKMPENPGIPPLFRDIFKNAFLPYRDPETLRAFLKIIDEFAYDHSERLGDAFEYLLSVLGSQGDAGQFRTPRHIIDFMVEVVDPKKTDVILDPACGTAGFLISAYKHILRQNCGFSIADCGLKSHESQINNQQSQIQNLLTPDERGRLAANFKGYDISPDMVRLSLVNLYLHGFTDPHIYEYDTLTSQDRWNEYADVILANPPFMSPKGGIKPHNRFSVQSKRSEVLFVDYMAEHLTPNGRAGIIVPEGIIFQSQTAYTQLRRLLVEEYLVAVVSLPAGVFQPYSGVKTSILILDKTLARQAQTIGFFKIEKDGYGLGAQRRGLCTEMGDKPELCPKHSDLPQARAEIAEYLRRLRARESLDNFLPALGLVVSKERIAANGDFNLSGERYRENAPQTGAFPWRKIETLVRTITPPTKIQKTAFAPSGRFPIIDQSQELIAGWTDDESAVVSPSIPLVIFGDHTCSVKLATGPFAQGADGIKILEAVDGVEPQYLFHVIRLRPLESVGYQRHFSLLKEMEIPLPPLSIQKEIVAEIEGYQKVIDGARAVLDNYRPHIPIRPEWPMVELGEVVTLQRGYDLPKQLWVNGPYPIVGSNGIIGFHASFKEDGPGVVTGRSGTIGKVHFIDYDHYWPHNTALFVKDFKGNDPRYVKVLLESIDLKSLGERTAAVPSLDRKNAHRVRVQVPPLDTQRAVVAEIEAEQALVTANRDLIARMEKKIQSTLARVWGEEKG